jgi:adenylate cyclase class IV
MKPMEELKIRIQSKERIEQRIQELGGEFEKKEKTRETYFQDQGDNALKIVEADGDSFLRKYESREEGFEGTRDEKIERPEQKKEELAQRFGVKTRQKKVQRFYSLKGKRAIIISIEGLGDFLVVQGEKVEKSFIEEETGIEDPEYIEVPFSDLEKG